MTITRRELLAGCGAGLASAAVPVPVFAAPKHTYDLVPVQVADGLWMIEGSTDYFTSENGGAIVNCALLDTADGLVIVDTGPSRRYGEALQEVAKTLNGRGVVALFNTHHHPDHFFGNQVFPGKPVYALGETKALAAAEGDGFADNMYRLLGDWMRGTEPVPPTDEITSSIMEIGGRKLRTLPLSGHTGADLALLDEKTGTLIAGDLAFLDRAPTTPHANLSAWRDALTTLEEVKAAAILPGHGPMDRFGSSLGQTRDYLDWLEKTLQAAAAEGLDMVEIMGTELPKEFADMGAMPQEFHRSIAHLYPGIERESLPLGN